MKTKYLLGILFVTMFTASCNRTIDNKHRSLTIQTKGIEYDSLFIRNTEIPPFFIKGEKADSITWTFQIPDSLYKTTASFEILPKPFDWNTNTTFKASFIATINGKDLYTYQLTLDEESSFFTLTYKDCSTMENIFLKAITPEGTDSTVIGKINQTIFTVEPDKDSETYIRLIDPFYSLFMSQNDTTYEEYVNRYTLLARQYPDSKYLISQFANHLSQYKDKKDVQTIYTNFSDKYKGSIWGEAVEKYLTAKFENISLPDALTEESTPIIKDSTRCTVIIFSASWCQPCHKQLPVQKEIYQKLKDKVDFVTISIDEKKTIKQWQEFVKKEELPWRSLLAYQDIAGVRGKYYVPHIPHTLLVYPDGNFEPFNLWEENEINKLYALTGN